MSFLHALRENAAFLMLALPLFGAALVGLSAGLGVEAVRRTALTNAALTLGLALVMAVGYDPAARQSEGTPRVVQMRSELRWLGSQADADRTDGPDVRLSVGVDGLSLAFLALTALVPLAAVCATPAAGLRAPAAFYALLLAWQSSLVGVFAACDVVLFALSLMTSGILAWLLVGGWGGPDRRRAALRTLGLSLLGGTLVLSALTGLVVSQWWMLRIVATGDRAGGIPPTFDIPSLLHWTPLLAARRAAAGQYWATAAPVLLGLLVAGFWTAAPFPPFHAAWRDTAAQSPRAVRLILGLWAAAALYGLLRFVGPLFEPLLASCRDLALVATTGGSLFLALLAVRDGPRPARLALVAFANLAQGAAAACSGSPAAWSGAVLLAAGTAICLAVAMQGEDCEATTEPSQIPDSPPAISQWGIVGLAAVPGCAGFAGLWLIWTSLAGIGSGTAHPLAVVLGVLSAGVAATACARMVVSSGPVDASGILKPVEPASRADRRMAAALLAVAAALGLAPGLLVDRLAPTIRAQSSSSGSRSAVDSLRGIAPAPHSSQPRAQP